MRDDIASALAGINVTSPVSPESSAAVRALYLPYHEREPYAGLVVTRDARYGPDERNRLDVFAPADRAERRPVVLFVHGGAYIGGDKRTPGTPYHDNVGVWAARNGFVGVTMTYRLAPAHPYPAGAQDVGAAVEWLHANIADHGGDPGAVTLLGHSAGAAHVACYAARTDLHRRERGGVNGLILMAGIYDFANEHPGPHDLAYFGDDPAARREASAVAGVVASGLPVMVVIAERDSREAHRQAKLMTDAIFARDGRNADFLYLPRHNHISQLSHLNASSIEDRQLSDRLAEFVSCAARSAPLPV